MSSAPVLGDCNAGLQGHAWALLSTLLTEVLPKTDWLKVWDHAFSNEPSFLLFLILSFMIVKRGQLAGCQSAEELDTVFRQTSTTDVNQVRLTPCQLHPPATLLTTIDPLLPQQQQASFSNFSSTENAAQSMVPQLCMHSQSPAADVAEVTRLHCHAAHQAGLPPAAGHATQHAARHRAAAAPTRGSGTLSCIQCIPQGGRAGAGERHGCATHLLPGSLR